MKLPYCNGNAGRVAGQHVWEVIGGERKRCVGCGKTRAELLAQRELDRMTPFHYTFRMVIDIQYMAALREISLTSNHARMMIDKRVEELGVPTHGLYSAKVNLNSLYGKFFMSRGIE